MPLAACHPPPGRGRGSAGRGRCGCRAPQPFPAIGNVWPQPPVARLPRAAPWARRGHGASTRGARCRPGRAQPAGAGSPRPGHFPRAGGGGRGRRAPTPRRRGRVARGSAAQAEPSRNPGTGPRRPSGAGRVGDLRRRLLHASACPVVTGRR